MGNVFTVPQQESDPSTATGQLIPVYAKSVDEFKLWAREKEQEYISKEAALADGAGGKKSKMKKFSLRQLLLCKDSGVSRFGSEVIEHCIIACGLDNNMKVEVIVSPDFSHSVVVSLLRELETGVTLMADLDRPLKPGFIIYKPIAPPSESVEGGFSVTKPDEKHMEFLEFLPKLFKQHESKLFIEIPSFHEAVDKFFCKFEEQKLEKSARAAEEAAQKKVKYTSWVEHSSEYISTYLFFLALSLGRESR